MENAGQVMIQITRRGTVDSGTVRAGSQLLRGPKSARSSEGAASPSVSALRRRTGRFKFELGIFEG